MAIVTLPATFIQRERDSGIGFSDLGVLGNGGWRGALRIAQRLGPLRGEGLGELGRRLPAEARVGMFGLVVRAPGRERGAAWLRDGNSVSFKSLSRRRPLKRKRSLWTTVVSA